MDKYAKLVEVLRAANPMTALPLITGEVTAVAGDSCTVKVGELELTDVRLRAVIDGSADKLLVTPEVGSMVLMGSLTNDLKDLAVIKVATAAKIEFELNGLNVLIDSTDGKVSITNGTTGMKALFQEINDVIKNLKVLTPSGPSTGLTPDSIAALTQFETHFKALLK